MNAPLEALPPPPEISEEVWRECRAAGDFRPILFEWYKYVGILCNLFACIRPESAALKKTPPGHFSILVGLLNRCARLMHSNVALSHEGLFGETTAILDRCIFESCVKVSWLCLKGTEESFARYIAEGLKTEVAFKAQITKNIADRGNRILEIERRMLASIQNYIAGAGLTEPEIEAAKKLPDLASMIEQLGQHRIHYLVGQRIGSHHVHGTWPSLRLHYLEEDESGYWLPRDHNCSTNANQYVFVPFAVLAALDSFFQFIMENPTDLEPLSGLLAALREEIQSINTEVIGKDFELVTGV